MIRDEAEYQLVKRAETRCNEDLLRRLRKKADGAGDFMLAELEANELENQLARLRARLAEYDEREHAGRGEWMTLFGGRRFWPRSPRPEDVDVRDIAHALSLINRFNGHTRVAYSVAQHSVLVCARMPPELRLFGLMHDAGEAYLGDVITPVKRLFRDFYEEAEDRVVRAAAEALGFDGVVADKEAKAEVKRGDVCLLATELAQLTTSGITSYPLTELPLDEPIVPWPADLAEAAFLRVFEELTDGERAVAA